VETETDENRVSLSLSLNDEELVTRAKADDQRAITELIHRYQPKAYAIAFHLCSEESDEARDVTQEALLKTIRSIKKFRGQASFSTWFYRIVVNTCRDFLRRKRKKERLFSLWQGKPHGNEVSYEKSEDQPDPKGHINPMAVLTEKQLTHDVRNALRELPDKQRMVFQLKVLHEMTIKEIAQVTGSSEGTIKSHLFRATHFLRNVLKEWAES
jgi:RNA polymerase sigma-70 factor (ECF subfamily)